MKEGRHMDKWSHWPACFGTHWTRQITKIFSSSYIYLLHDFITIKTHDSKNSCWKILLLWSGPRKRTIYESRNLDSSSGLPSSSPAEPGQVTLHRISVSSPSRALGQAMLRPFLPDIPEPNFWCLRVHPFAYHLPSNWLLRRLVVLLCSNLLILLRQRSLSWLLPRGGSYSIWLFFRGAWGYVLTDRQTGTPKTLMASPISNSTYSSFSCSLGQVCGKMGCDLV